MGILPQELGLYQGMRDRGYFAKVRKVFDIGATDIQCAGYEDAVASFLNSMGRPVSPNRAKELSTAPAKDFYDALGIEYWSMDASGLHQSIVMDLNLDSVPDEHRHQFDLVTNFGTTEHALNQVNCFKIAHDLCKPGGLMIHDVPYGGSFPGLCMFSYNPQVFDTVARANGYDYLGCWINPDQKLTTFIPFSDGLLRYLHVTAASTTMIAVLFRKPHDREFNIAYQHRGYEASNSDTNAARYLYTLPDGEQMDGRTVKRIAIKNKKAIYSPEQLPMKRLAKTLVSEFVRRSRERLLGKPRIAGEKQERVFNGH